MENEKYGVQLFADTSEFKKSLEELSKMVKEFKDNLKDNFEISFTKDIKNSNVFKEQNNTEVFNETKRYTELTRLIDKAEISVKNYTSQIEQLKRKMEETANESEKTFEQLERLRELDFKADNFNNFTEAEALLYSDLAKDKDKLEKNEQKYFETTKKDEEALNELIQKRIVAEQQLQALRDKRNQEAKSGSAVQELETLKRKYEELKSSGKTTGNVLKSLFDGSIRKIKNFTYYLLGARTVFGMLMKYQNIYYQYNDKMQYQMELSQNTIALSLAPAFEFLGNMIAYASIGIAKFIELLTGVNVLSKVSTKGIRDYNKSLKETQSLLSGVDEITNLTMPNGTDLASQYNALKDFQDKAKKFDEWWAGFKTDFWNWLTDPELMKLINEKGIIKVTFDLGMSSFTNLYNKLLKPEIDNLKVKLKEDLKVIWEPLSKELEPVLTQIEDTWNNFFKPKIIDPVADEFNDLSKNILKDMAPFLNNIIDLWNDTFGWIFGKIDRISVETDETKDKINFDLGEIGKKVKDVFKDQKVDVKYSVKADIKDVAKKLKGIASTFEASGGIFGNVGSIINKKLASLGYEKGLDYVPYDEYPAVLHKGEAVVPAKYNPTIHSQGNEYTNSLLETLIIKVDDLSKRPNEFIIDGQKFAETTYPLYENARSRNNYIEGVVR